MNAFHSYRTCSDFLILTTLEKKVIGRITNLTIDLSPRNRRHVNKNTINTLTKQRLKREKKSPAAIIFGFSFFCINIINNIYSNFIIRFIPSFFPYTLSLSFALGFIVFFFPSFLFPSCYLLSTFLLLFSSLLTLIIFFTFSLSFTVSFSFHLYISHELPFLFLPFAYLLQFFLLQCFSYSIYDNCVPFGFRVFFFKWLLYYFSSFPISPFRFLFSSDAIAFLYFSFSHYFYH